MVVPQSSDINSWFSCLRHITSIYQVNIHIQITITLKTNDYIENNMYN